MHDAPFEERPAEELEIGRAGTPEVVGSDAKDWLPDKEILALLEERDSVIPIVGAGVSMAAGIAGVSGLCEHLKSRFNIHFALGTEYSDPNNLFAVADEIVNDDFRIESAVQTATAEYFRKELESWEPVEVTRHLVSVPSGLIITLNYDLSLESTAEEIGLEVRSWDGLHDIRQFTQLVRRDIALDGVTIMHIHGTVADPRTIILTDGSYGRITADGEHNRLWESLVRDRRMAFLGTRLNEAHILTALQSAIKKSGRKHPYFATGAEVLQLQRSGRLVPTLVRHGIKLVELPSRDHLRGVIRHLGRPDSGSAAGVAGVGPRPLPPSHYVPNVIYEADTEEASSPSTLWLGLVSDQASSSEEDLASEPRALIVGIPGSGKSELLRYTAYLVPRGELPVFVALTDVPFEAAEPSLQLNRWLARAQILGSEGWAPPDPDASMEQQSLHFFLDGLDEVTPRDQHRVTAQIVALATAFPQHAFTVASRPVESNTLFPGDWRRFVLAPGYVWQQRYLAARGIVSDELLSALDVGRDLNDLARIPFFLARMVDLIDEVAGLDLWGIVQRLISKALATEQARNLLPVSEGPARRWLSELALAMALNGSTVIGFDELETLDLPDGLVADPSDRHQIAEICERLVSRAMLQKRHEGYAFAHRILGEALAAEALDEREPTDLLLEAIVPVAGDEVRGVRADWRVPLTFLLLRNDRWRAAVRPRDDMQWARSVPSGAGLAEREEAANLIWDRYVHWRTWIWEYDVPDIVQDVDALARHLRSGELKELTVRLVAAIDDPSPQTQGNAIRVLSRARVRNLDATPLLRRVLEDDTRESVVRRQAAIAAGELGLTELLSLIVMRGSHPADSSEAQDAARVALRLACESEVLGVALELVAHRDTHSVVMSTIGERLSPRDMVRFLRGFAVLDDDPLPFERKLLASALDKLEGVDDEVVEDVAAISAHWGLHGSALKDLFTTHREAALRGASTSISDNLWSWRGDWVIDLFASDELRTAGYPAEIVERSAQYERRLEEVVSIRAEPEGAAEPLEEEKGLSLSELLAKPRGEVDEIIAYHSEYYRRETDSLTKEERTDLIERLQNWWPSQAFPDTITWKERSADSASWSMNSFAAAWLWFGPKLDLSLEPRQWAEIAISGVLFEEQIEWLQRQSSEEGAVLLAEIATATDARFWHDALRATPDPIPGTLIEAVAARVETSERRHHIEEIVRRLAEADAVSALQHLAAKECFTQVVMPYLAARGDRTALEDLFDQLVTNLGTHPLPDREQLFWLAGVGEDPHYLPWLFNALVDALKPNKPANASFQSGRSFVDVSPLIAAIHRIGGEAAINGYDDLLKEHENLQFLRLQRDNIVQAEVSKLGLKAAAQAAEEQHLPYRPGSAGSM